MISLSTEKSDSSCLTHRVLTSLDEINSIADAWQSLQHNATDGFTYFQSFDWCHAWIASFGNPHCQPVICTVWKDQQLIALLPLMREGSKIRKLKILGTPHTQYANILIDPTLDASTHLNVLTHLRELLDGMHGHDLTLLEHVPHGSPLAEILIENPPMSTHAQTAAIFDLSGFASEEDYIARLNKKQRRNRTRRRSVLEQIGQVSFDVLFPDSPDFAPALNECLRLKRTWLRETGRISIGLNKIGIDDFLTSLPGNKALKSGSCLSVLSVDGRLAAGELGFLYHGHYYAYLGAFDWDLSAASPGKLQMDMTITWLISQGISKYDLLGNESNYKAAWSNTALELKTHSLPSTFIGRAYAGLWIARMRPNLKRLYEKMPPKLRQLAQITQCIIWMFLAIELAPI